MEAGVGVLPAEGMLISHSDLQMGRVLGLLSLAPTSLHQKTTAIERQFRKYKHYTQLDFESTTAAVLAA